MRWAAAAYLVGALLMSTACGGSPTGPSNHSGAVQFRLDQNTCGALFGTRTLTFNFFVDGVGVGTDTLGIGTTSRQYPTVAGTHVASASVTNSTIRWENLNFSVTANQTFTYVLLCQ